MSAIEKMSGTEEFGKGVAEKGKDVVAGAKNLVTAPVDTLSSAGSGVKKLSFGLGAVAEFGQLFQNTIGKCSRPRPASGKGRMTKTLSLVPERLIWF